MAMKKNQHLVPVCYLKNFQCRITNESDNRKGSDGAIYVSNNKLSSGWKMRGLKHNSFVESYFYNIEGDDPNHPQIEDFLAKVEFNYPRNFKEIENGKIDNDNMSFMSYFTMIQFIRVEVFIKSMQDTFDKVAMYIDGFCGTNEHSLLFKDIVKKQIVSLDLGGVIHPYSTIVYNDTNFPFITSDNPVVNRAVNVNDLLKVIPKEYVVDHGNNSDEFNFIFFPLSPKIAYVSYKLLSTKDKIIISEASIANVFYLNLFSIYNSHKNIYSPIDEPIKGERELSIYLSSERGFIVKIFTAAERVISKGMILSDSDTTLTVKVDDLDAIENIKKGEFIKLIEIIKNGDSIRGIRNCRVSSVRHNNGIITFKSNLPYGI